MLEVKVSWTGRRPACALQSVRLWTNDLNKLGCAPMFPAMLDAGLRCEAKGVFGSKFGGRIDGSRWPDQHSHALLPCNLGC